MGSCWLMRKKWNLLGILSAVIKAQKKGVIMREFDECSDGIFPAPDLVNIGLKHCASKSCFIFVHMLP